MATTSLVGIFRCPVCHLELFPSDRTLRCARGHSFDIAREGYANLLLANQKASREPGDNAAMLASRRRFLEAGFYDPLSDAINQSVRDILNTGSGGEFSILDSGCGEGYYLRRLLKHVEADTPGAPVSGYGLDVSKVAVRMAAARDRNAFYVVGSSYNLPFLSDKLSAILTVFAPVATAEYQRVLARDGTLLVIQPGPYHLMALKRLLYDHPVENELHPLDTSAFQLAETKRVAYSVDLPAASAIDDLFKMTPFYYQASRDRQELVEAQHSLTTELDFVLQVYQKVGNDIGERSVAESDR